LLRLLSRPALAKSNQGTTKLPLARRQWLTNVRAVRSYTSSQRCTIVFDERRPFKTQKVPAKLEVCSAPSEVCSAPSSECATKDGQCSRGHA